MMLFLVGWSSSKSLSGSRTLRSSWEYQRKHEQRHNFRAKRAYGGALSRAQRDQGGIQGLPGRGAVI
ncbi:hypothetical protein B0T18DRAFT_416074, partial [Schizothecium vesticola]